METNFMSLYEYLGRPAGSDLGKAVATAAAKSGVRTSTKEVSNPTYKGSIMTYPKSFLDLYFTGGPITESKSSKQLLKG